MPTPETIHIKIQTRQEIIYEGDVLSVSSKNDTGPFDILPEHANFISIVKDQIVLRFPNKQQQQFRLQTGILQVEEGRVNVYIES